MQQGEYGTGRDGDKLKREKETGIAIQKTNGITESGIKQHFNFLLQGLDELTYYSVQVRAIRNELSHSNFSNPLSFETPAQFPVPTHFAADVTDQGVTFSWQGEADAYVLSYKTTDAAAYTDVAVNANELTLDYEQLQLVQNYTARLRGVYGESDSSAWTTEISFSTPCGIAKPAFCRKLRQYRLRYPQLLGQQRRNSFRLIQMDNRGD